MVTKACGGKLEVLPLTDHEVERWRELCLGSQAPWAPTLIRVDGSGVRAWTRPGMAIPLLCGLGPRPAVRVIRALGELSHREDAPSAEQTGPPVIGRKQFLQFGTGVAAAAGLLLAGKTPALASKHSKAAQRWVAANMSRLPEHYEELASYSLQYRQAIFAASSPSIRSRFWTEQLQRYRASHPRLSASQANALGRATVFAGNPAHFTAGSSDRPGIRKQVNDLHAATVEAFGLTTAYALIGTLGPGEISGGLTSSSIPNCYCNIGGNWACYGNGNCGCRGPICCFNPTSNGCGPFWQWPCDGICYK